MTPLGVPVEPEVKMMYSGSSSRARAAVSQQRRVLAALEQILRDEDLAAEFQRPGFVVKRALHDHQVGVERI